MSMRYNGGLLSSNNVTQYASGIWTIRQQLQTPKISSSPPVGQSIYLTSGTYTWVAPAGVTSVCVVCVGSSLKWASNLYYGRGGAGLGWKNNITVVPGTSYTVVVSNGDVSPTDSYFINTSTVRGGTGTGTTAGGTYTGDGGGNGGTGGAAVNTTSGAGGGGAGGYSGNGGNGGAQGANNGAAAATNSGGGGGGAGGTSGAFGGGGGGVHLFGIGSTGSGGVYGAATNNLAAAGNFGSYGKVGTMSNTGGGYSPPLGGGYAGTSAQVSGGGTAPGGVRIIWGPGRSFPATNTFNMY
jgi:hypothetical protein